MIRLPPVEDMMPKFMFLSIAAFALASPAFAASNENGSKGTANPTPSATAAPQREQRFCVVSVLTGSRITHKECKTRNEWLAEGFDPLVK